MVGQLTRLSDEDDAIVDDNDFFDDNDVDNKCVSCTLLCVIASCTNPHKNLKWSFSTFLTEHEKWAQNDFAVLEK